jgi:hypothetical protein
MPQLDPAALAAAASSLATANTGQAPEPTPEPTVQPEPSVQPTPDTQATPDSTTPEVTAESTPTPAQAEQVQDALDLGVDPTTLPPELQAIYRHMQAGWTNKTTEVATMRQVQQKLAAMGITDPEAIAHYAGIAAQMDRDPAYAQRVAAHIQKLYGAPPETSPAQASDDQGDMYDESDDIPPALQQRLDAMENKFKEMEDETSRQQLANELQKQEDTIRRQHQDYEQADWDQLWALAYSTGGDLIKANEMYIESQARIAQKFLSNKLTVPTLQQPPVVATQPVEDAPEPTRDFKTAHEMAVERLKALAAG